MDSENFFVTAEGLFLEGEYEKALYYFKKSNEISETIECLNYIGCCYIWLNDLESAEKIFCRILETNSSWERPVFNLGRVYLKLGNLNEALQCFEKALNINSNEDDINYYMGVVYYKLDKYEKAKEFYQKSINLNGKQSEAHLNLGMCYLRLKNYEKALEEFNNAYVNDNDCLDAIYNKGIALISMSRYNEALDNLLILLNRNPNDIEAMMDIAHCYYKISDTVNANVWVSKVLAIEPQHNLANKLLKRLTSLMT